MALPLPAIAETPEGAAGALNVGAILMNDATEGTPGRVDDEEHVIPGGATAADAGICTLSPFGSLGEAERHEVLIHIGLMGVRAQRHQVDRARSTRHPAWRQESSNHTKPAPGAEAIVGREPFDRYGGE